MKKFLFLLSFVLVSLMGLMNFAALNTPASYYYAFEERVPLEAVPNKVLLRYAAAGSRAARAAALRQQAGAEISLRWRDDRTVLVTLAEGAARQSLLRQVAADATILAANQVYAVSTGLELGVTDEILVRFRPTAPRAQRLAMRLRYHLAEIAATDLYLLWRVGKGQDALAVANALQETGLTEFAYPNFVSEIELHQTLPNDTYFNQQFNLHNTGQTLPDGHAGTADADIDAPEAWTYTQGSSAIVVAVVDEGVSANHPDLPASRQVRLAGSNFADGDPNDPSPTGNHNHGNASAGLEREDNKGG